MKLFMIGGTGYLGRRILRELSYDESLEIVALARGEVPADLRLKNVSWVAGDTGETGRYAERFRGSDIFLYMGGIPSPAQPAERDALLLENVTKLERLLPEVRRRDVKLFVYVTCLSALGDTGNVTGDEERAAKPGFGSPFEESMRLALERVADLKPDVKTIVAFVGPTFGPGDPGYLMPILERAAQGRSGTLVGGRHYLSPLHVEDLKEGLLQLLLRGEDNRRYILCGEPIELSNLAHMAAQIAGHGGAIRSSEGLAARLHAGVLGRAGYSPFHPSLVAYLTGGNYAYESHRAKKELRWSHGRLRDRLEEALKEAGIV